MSQEPPLKYIPVVWFLKVTTSYSQPLNLHILGGRLWEDRLYYRAVTKRQGHRISLGYLHRKVEEKCNQKEIPSCLIPRLLVVFTRQLEILVTTLVLRIKDFCLTILLYPALLSRSIPIETVSRPSSSALHMRRNWSPFKSLTALFLIYLKVLHEWDSSISWWNKKSIVVTLYRDFKQNVTTWLKKQTNKCGHWNVVVLKHYFYALKLK